MILRMKNHLPTTPNGKAGQSLPHENHPDTSTQLVCHLSDGSSFFPDINFPPVPVVTAFGAGGMHQCRFFGVYDLARAVSENRPSLLRSFRGHFPALGLNGWENAIFRFGEREFICADKAKVVGYAPTPETAERLAANFSAAYSKPLPETGGCFQLIRICSSLGVDCENVRLGPDTVLTEDQLRLHYPGGTEEWHSNFVGKLQGKRHGLSIFEGPPGTGKTSYLRHLMGALRESHCFYFIPPSSMGVLSKPEFVGFWANQRHLNSSKKLVVILEDADAALMTRSADNREQVSALLNLSDGMLGDFLALYIICTINCAASEIDQALLRPGRLICHRMFNRLSPPEARRLAGSLGVELPEGRDYSLAEVFAGEANKVASRPHIGFGGK